MREPLPSHRNAPLVGRFRTCHMLAHLAAGSGLIFMVQQYEGTAPSTHTLWVSRFCSLTTGACLIQSAPQPALPWRFLFARAFHSRPAMGGFRPRPGVPPHTQIQRITSFIISYPAKDQKELRKVTGRIPPRALKNPAFSKINCQRFRRLNSPRYAAIAFFVGERNKFFLKKKNASADVPSLWPGG